ncbi:hypothetical protein Ga0466249_004963 [Sporomusaceae bacterium BoRhaA]|nr:hypothetical protein [Pelorhabdus rhamnosifermentans]
MSDSSIRSKGGGDKRWPEDVKLTFMFWLRVLRRDYALMSDS